MAARIIKLYPGPSEEVTLQGAYLAHALHKRGSPAKPFVYASFVSSLDGRIAVRDPDTGAGHLPTGLTSGNDFRLLLELQAQADCLITHAGYLRDLAAGRLDDVLQIGSQADGRDLARWRVENGLTPQPAVVIASSSLDFPFPPSLDPSARRVFIAVSATAPAQKVEALRAKGYPVLIVGAGGWVEGGALVRRLSQLGFRSLYLLAGPRMLETMLRDGVLSRLYLTMTHQLFGGEQFHTMISSPELGRAGRLRLSELYYDATAPDGVGQWFTCFDAYGQS